MRRPKCCTFFPGIRLLASPVRSAGKGSIFNPSMVSASMGIYIFNTDALVRLIREDAENPASSHALPFIRT